MDDILRFFSRKDLYLKLGNNLAQIKIVCWQYFSYWWWAAKEGLFRCLWSYSCSLIWAAVHLLSPVPWHGANRAGPDPELNPRASAIIKSAHSFHSHLFLSPLSWPPLSSQSVPGLVHHYLCTPALDLGVKQTLVELNRMNQMGPGPWVKVSCKSGCHCQALLCFSVCVCVCDWRVTHTHNIIQP